MATAAMGGSPNDGITATSPTVQTIEPTLNIAGDTAGTKK